MEDGRRLENLTWRLWNRETLCCESQPQHNHTTTPTIDLTKSRPGRKDVPGLSASVESLVSIRSDSSEDPQQPATVPLQIHASAAPKSEPMLSRSRGKEKHITSLGLEKMVHSIQDKHAIAPLSPSIADAMPPKPPSTDVTSLAASPTLNAPLRSSDSSSSTALLSSPESDKSAQQTVGSDTSAEMLNSHSIIRGFSMGKESSYRSHTHLAPEAIPMKHAATNKPENPSKKGAAVFMLGGCSSGEEDSSLDEKMASQPQQSSLTQAIKERPENRKMLSFRDEVESRALEKRSHEDEEVFESEDEDESAIDDDSEEEEDDDDWEDDASENAENTANDKPLFQRVDSQPNLVSRRSVLTTELHQLDRAATFANLASKSTPVIRRSKTTSTSSGPPDGVSPVEDPSLTMLPGHTTRSRPILVTARSAQQMAFSPKTTRRNMLATEMTESLRKNVLWERQQKKATTNAIIKRRHTAQNLTNLQNYPGEVMQASTQGSRNSSSEHYFEQGLGLYHIAGW